jgi:hypothetical protein
MMLGALNVYKDDMGADCVIHVGINVKNKKSLKLLVRFLERNYEGGTETYAKEKKGRKKNG